MAALIEWGNSIHSALQQAEHKFVLLAFFSPNCEGCRAMDRVTYVDQEVATYVAGHFVPCKISIRQNLDLAAQYRLAWIPDVLCIHGDTWIPKIFWLDANGVIHHDIVGFHPPRHFLVELGFGYAKAALSLRLFDEAISSFKLLLARDQKSYRADEVSFWLGVAQYRATGNRERLIETWDMLRKSYPESIWAKKVSVYFSKTDSERDLIPDIEQRRI